MPPTLTTDRLLLSPHRTSDLEEMAALLADPVVMAPIGAPPSTREQTWHRLLRYVGHWATLGYGHWVVRDRAGTYLGDIGLMDSRRATDPGFEGVVEAGWLFATAAQGQGYAREACAAMLAWADAHGIAKTVCIIAPDNAPSLRLAERLGYRRWAMGTYNDDPTVMLERNA
jgi:RimJ/RimL family protein N-acetyltransferase